MERAAAHSAVPFPQGRGEDPNSELEGAWDLPVYQRRQSADGSHALPERCTSSGSLLSRAPRVFGSLYEEQDQVPTTPASPDAQRHASKDSSPSRTKPRALLVTQRSTTEQGSPWWRLTRALLRRGFHVRRLESPSGGGLLDGAPVDFVFVDSALACSASQPGPNEASRDVSGTSDVSGGGSGSGSASAGSSSAIVQCSDLLRSDTCTQQRTGQEGSGASSGDVWWSCGGSSRDPPQDGARSGNSASFRRTPGPASRVQQRRIQAPQDEIRACRSHRTNSGRTGSAMPPENAPQGAAEESAGAHAPRDGAPAVLVLSEVTHGERCRLEGLVVSVKWTMRGPGDWDALHHILADAHEGPAR